MKNGLSRFALTRTRACTALQCSLLLCLVLLLPPHSASAQQREGKERESKERESKEPESKESREKKEPSENIVSQNALQTASTQLPSNEPVFGSRAMVVSAHPAASHVGAAILKRGGNAVDAAIAVQFALAVCYPVAGNIGGGGFMVLRLANGTTDALDFREMAPERASRDMFLDTAGTPIPKLSTFGHRASGIPGTTDGMAQAHARYGKLPWAVLLQPAIDLARSGVELTEREARGLNAVAQTFREYNPDKAYFLPPTPTLSTPQQSTPEPSWKAGDTLRQADLAAVLERIRDKGRDGFYRGETARLLLAEMQQRAQAAASLNAVSAVSAVSADGIFQQSDLDAYRAVWRTPVITRYKQYRIVGMPPPSSGGVGVAQMLNVLAQFPVKTMGHNSSQTAHLMIETERRYFAERAEHLGDPDFYAVPLRGLVNPHYAAERMKSFSPDRATPSSEVTHGDKALLQRYESMETTHFSIVDENGNAVAITTTLNGGYGSKVIVGGAGFLMNNEMDDFSVKPGVPNMFGAVGGEANAIAPRKRMLSSMTPTIVERVENGEKSEKSKNTKNTKNTKSERRELFMVVGSPGGTTILTSVLQAIVNVVEHGMTMQQAVNARRFHHQHLPDAVLAETGAFTPEVLAALKAKGHSFNDIAAIGKVDAILVHPAKQPAKALAKPVSTPSARQRGKSLAPKTTQHTARMLEGAADPRGDDTAVGY
jgi:gamma-glutamyltranspeptidase / glutathione hydrolase